MSRKAYPSDVSDEEWAFVAPYLTLMREDAPQREHSLREVFNGLRWMVRTAAPWRMMPHDLPPWHTVYQQAQRWFKAGVFEEMIHDLRALLRLAKGKHEQPTAAIFDGRTVQSTPESGERAGYDGYKRKKGSKIHLAVEVQAVTGENVEVAFVDQGYTGEPAQQAAEKAGIDLIVVKVEAAKKGFVLLPRRWVVERSFGWSARFRRLVRDFERSAETLAGLHFVAFAMLMLAKFVKTIAFVL